MPMYVSKCKVMSVQIRQGMLCTRAHCPSCMNRVYKEWDYHKLYYRNIQQDKPEKISNQPGSTVQGNKSACQIKTYRHTYLWCICSLRAVKSSWANCTLYRIVKRKISTVARNRQGICKSTITASWTISARWITQAAVLASCTRNWIRRSISARRSCRTW